MLYTNAFKGTVYLCVSDRFHGGEDDFILKSRTTKIQTHKHNTYVHVLIQLQHSIHCM